MELAGSGRGGGYRVATASEEVTAHRYFSELQLALWAVQPQGAPKTTQRQSQRVAYGSKATAVLAVLTVIRWMVAA